MKQNRLVWIDLLNIVACMGVLLLHCTNKEVHHFSGVPSVNWFIGLFTHSFFLWPVNVFFMISGFTLVKKFSLPNNDQEGVEFFYKKRIKRLAIPLLSWNILYMLKHLVSSYYLGETIEPIPELIKRFILFDFNGFMWFFIPLIMIYLALPFFSVFTINSNRNLLRLFLLIGLIMSCIPPLEGSFTVKEGLKDIYLMGSRFLYFIVAGYYIGSYQISSKTRHLIYTLSIVNIFIMYLGTVLLTLYFPDHYRYFIQYTNIPCTIVSMGVFTFFKYQDWDIILKKIHITKKQLACFSSFSLGIYLIQGLWFSILNTLHICEEYILLRFIVMYFLCIVSVWIIKHIPIIRQMVE